MKEFKLENERKIDTGFKTPDLYFEDLSARVLQDLPTKDSKVISLYQRYKGGIIIAAAILILALMVPIFNSPSAITSQIDESTMENYLAYQTNIFQYDLISEMDAEDIAQMQPYSTDEDQAIEEILTSDSYVEHLISE